MHPNPLVTIIIPCYNEEDSIPSLVERLRVLVESQPDWEVLFVNDGSRDATGRILDQASCKFAWARVAHHKTNLGLGAGIRTGFSNTEAPYICTIDSDGSYPPETLPQFIELLRSGADIVTASPWHPGNQKADGGLHRIILSRGVSWCYRLVTRSDHYTYTALFRAYRREVIENVKFESNGFPAVTELLIRAIAKGYRLVEVPMPLIPRERGESKMSFGTAIRGHLKLLAQAPKWMRSERDKILQPATAPPRLQ